MVFTPKSNICVRCWIVRSLGNPTKQNGRLCDILRTMREKASEILALSEVRRPGHGVFDLNEEVIVHSGMEASAKQHRHRGVAIVMGKRAAGRCRMAGSVFDLVSERILQIRISCVLDLSPLLPCIPQPMSLGMRKSL